MLMPFDAWSTIPESGRLVLQAVSESPSVTLGGEVPVAWVAAILIPLSGAVVAQFGLIRYLIAWAREDSARKDQQIGILVAELAKLRGHREDVA